MVLERWDVMTKKVTVTRAQKKAAQAMVKRSAVTGRPVSPSVHKIANATVEFRTEEVGTGRPRT